VQKKHSQGYVMEGGVEISYILRGSYHNIQLKLSEDILWTGRASEGRDKY